MGDHLQCVGVHDAVYALRVTFESMQGNILPDGFLAAKTHNMLLQCNLITWKGFRTLSSALLPLLSMTVMPCETFSEQDQHVQASQTMLLKSQSIPPITRCLHFQMVRKGKTWAVPPDITIRNHKTGQLAYDRRGTACIDHPHN